MAGVLPMKRIVLNGVFGTLAVAFGCIIGWAFTLGTAQNEEPSDSTLRQRLEMHERISPESIKLRMKEFQDIAMDHKFHSIMAGENENLLSKKIQAQWMQVCDTVETYQYRSLISKPKSGEQSGWSFQDTTKIYDFNSGNFTFVAYSPSGAPSATTIDYKPGVDHQGQICMVKMQHINYETTYMQAESDNCSGILVFPDLEIFYGLSDDDYQFSSANYFHGDPARSNQAVIIETELENLRKMNILPSIPILPISNSDYNTIKTQCLTSNICRVEMRVMMEETIVTTETILGYIYGNEDPGKYIMIGASHDTFGPGASTTANSYAILNEILEIVVETMRKSNWKPKRTIVFASFGSSKLGNIAGTEWVLQNKRKISAQMISYIDLDQMITSSGFENSTFTGNGSPLMNKLLLFLAGEIRSCPDCITLLQKWQNLTPNPVIALGDDRTSHEPMYEILGVPFVQFKHTSGSSVSPVAYSYKDIIDYFEKEMDPEYLKSKEISALALSFIRVLSDNYVYDFDVLNYAENLRQELVSLQDEYSGTLNNESFENLIRTVNALKETARSYDSYVLTMDSSNIANRKLVNSVSFNFEKCFLSDYDVGINSNEKSNMKRHIIFSTVKSFSSFPRLRTLLTDSSVSQMDVEREIGMIYWHMFQADQIMFPAFWSRPQQ